MPDRPDYLLIPPKTPNLQAQYPRPNGHAAPIQAPLANIDALFETVRQLKMAVDSLIGQTGRSTNRAVTFDDLVTLGLVTQQAVTTAQPALGDSRVDKLETGLDKEARDRTTADDTLQANIDAEAAARAAADTTLQTNINSEAATRAAADVTLQNNINLKADINSPTFTGDPKAPTPAPGDNDTSVATTAYVTAAVAVVSGGGPFAPLASPTFTGDPKAPTPATADNDTSIATTAYVRAQGYAVGPVTWTVGSIAFATSTSALGQDNANLFWDDTNNRLGIGTATPQSHLEISSSNTDSTELRLVNLDTGGRNWAIRSTGSVAGAGPGKFLITDRTASATRMTVDSTGNVGIGTATPGSTLDVNGTLRTSSGIQSHAGMGGAYQTNVFNFQWVGNAHLWVDNVDTGVITVTCDYRIKENVADLPSTWDKVKALRPVSYSLAANSELLREEADPAERWGFLAHELQETLIPSAATGYKDAPNLIQSPDLMTLMAALTCAVQEAMTRIEAFEL